MSKFTKLAGIVSLAAMLTACGGGSGDDTPSNVPKEDIIPSDLSSEFIPFEDQSIIDKIKALITGSPSSPQRDIDYNVALGHMIGEVFGDNLILRDSRIEKLKTMAEHAITFRNHICTDLATRNTEKVLTLKSGKDSCVNAANTLKSGSVISIDENGDTKTITFKDVLFGSNVDFKLKDQYLVNGTIKYISNAAKDSYVIDKLSYQRLKGGTSQEYLDISDYTYLLEKGVAEQILTAKGKISGQPSLANFNYKFDYETTSPFKMAKGLLTFNHFPQAGGNLRLIDRYFQVIEVKQTKDKNTKATVAFNGSDVGELAWSEITGKK